MKTAFTLFYHYYLNLRDLKTRKTTIAALPVFSVNNHVNELGKWIGVNNDSLRLDNQKHCRAIANIQYLMPINAIIVKVISGRHIDLSHSCRILDSKFPTF